MQSLGHPLDEVWDGIPGCRVDLTLLDDLKNHGMSEIDSRNATIQNTRFRDGGFASCHHGKQHLSTDTSQSFFWNLTRDIQIIAIPNNFPWDHRKNRHGL